MRLIFPLLVAAVAGIFFAMLDSLFYRSKWKIMHGLGGAVRLLVLALVSFGSTDNTTDALFLLLACAGMFGLVFRPCFNTFSALELDYMGMTAYYDRFWRWFTPRLGSWVEPSWAAGIFEFSLLMIGLLHYFAT